MKTLILKGIRSAYCLFFRPKFLGWKWCSVKDRCCTNKVIQEKIQSSDQSFAGRVVIIEQAIVLNYLSILEKRVPLVNW